LTGLGVQEHTDCVLGCSSSGEESLVGSSGFGKLFSIAEDNLLDWVFVFAVIGDESVVLELVRVLSDSVVVQTFLIRGIPSKLSTLTDVVLSDGPTNKTLASNRLFWLSVTALENCTRGAYSNDVVIRSHGLYNVVVDPVGVSTESSLEVLAVLLRSNSNSVRVLVVGSNERVGGLMELSTFALVKTFEAFELTLPFLLKSSTSGHVGSFLIISTIFVGLQSLLAIFCEHLVNIEVLFITKLFRIW
jgi:hypothetical protein